MTSIGPRSLTLSELTTRDQLAFFGFRRWEGQRDDPNQTVKRDNWPFMVHLPEVMIVPSQRLADIPNGTPLLYIGKKEWRWVVKGHDALDLTLRDPYLPYGLARKFHADTLSALKEKYLRRD